MHMGWGNFYWQRITIYLVNKVQQTPASCALYKSVVHNWWSLRTNTVSIEVVTLKFSTALYIDLFFIYLFIFKGNRGLLTKPRPTQNSSASHQLRNTAIIHLCASVHHFHSAKTQSPRKKTPGKHSNETFKERSRGRKNHYGVYGVSTQVVQWF